jgi:transcriptional regulator with XRE-family HTH domain
MPRAQDPQPELARAIRELRAERGLSQEELGHLADLHYTRISHIESGRVSPSWGNVRRIAEALGISVAELATRAESYERKP